MTNIIEPLTQEERAVLMIAAHGESVMDLGEHSRWHGAIQSLVRRGMLTRHDQFNHSITDLGRAQSEAAEDAEDAAIADAVRGFEARVSAHRQQIAESPLGVYMTAQVGPSVAGGVLFFKMPDGSSINCKVAEPFASQIVEMWNNR